MKNYKINSISHITGGGLLENLPRSVPEHLSVEIDSQSWQMPEVFEWLKNEQEKSDASEVFAWVLSVSISELFAVFGAAEAEAMLADIADAARCEHEHREFH